MSKHPASNPGDASPPRSTVATRRPTRHPWSDPDLAALRRFCEQSLDDEDIARRLGRTPRAVRTMILRLGGARLREPSRPWSDAELEIALRLHAAGAICAVIAESLPGRTPVAVFRKLCRLVGPAPSTEAKRSWRAAKRTASAPKPEDAPIRISPPPPRIAIRTPQPPQQPLPATLEAMVRWLRSRDFVVLRKSEGWLIDHHHLSCDEALVAFVNLRRARLHLPPFSLAEPRIMPAAIVSQVVRGRRWGQPHHAVRRA